MKKIISLIMLTFIILMPVYAYSEESAKAHAYYAHPETGVIEDAGNNPGIGQGMCENVLHETALFEEVDGQLYLCVRYNLANHIDNVSFAVQNRGDKNFITRDYEVLNENIVSANKASRDYRFKVPSKDVIVRSTFFVGPMGRDVVFYYDFSDFVSGNTDFIPLGEGGTIQNIVSSNSSSTEGQTIEVKAVNNLLSAGELGYDHGLLMKNSPEIKSIYGEDAMKSLSDGSSEISDSDAKSSEEWGSVSEAMLNGFIILLVLIVFFFLVSAIIMYFVSKHIKNLNYLREEMLYEED